MDWQQTYARTRNGLIEIYGFLRYLAKRFVADGCLHSAATLSYTTLLSLVPLFAVSLSILTAFPVFESLNVRIQDFLFQNLVPATGEVVQSYMQEFAGRAAGLSAVGLFGILISAILMVGAIDKALNRIWRVQRPRRPVQSFMVYWTVITVGPFLVAISLVASSYLIALTEFAGGEHARGIREFLLEATPMAAIFAAFTFLYSAVPNRRVPFVHALAGAAFAALLFELAKRGFALFVTNFPSYEAIYGALATLPIFLIWIYLSWVVVLLGAEFTQALSGYREGREGTLSDPRNAMLLAVRLIGDFWRAQQSGRALGRKDLLEREPDAGEIAIQDALETLERINVIHRTDDGRWMLARDPASFTLMDLYREYPFVLADVPDNVRDKDAWNRALGGVLREAMDGVEHALSMPIREVFRDARRDQRAGNTVPFRPATADADDDNRRG